MQAFPGVGDYLMTARQHGLGIAIASSSEHSWVENHLSRLGLLKSFDFLVCREDTAAHKPDPAPYLEVLRRLNISASEAAAIEDSPNGIRAAKAAGLFCIAVPNSVTRSLKLDEADVRVNSLAEFPFQSLLRVANKTLDK